jgi:hypothetical protein
MYSAIYLPARAEGEADPSRSGFATEEEAEEYVVSRMCQGCKEERRKAIAGEPWDREEFEPSKYPSCFCEWLTGKTEEFEAATNDDEFMQAGGYGPAIEFTDILKQVSEEGEV